MPNGSMEALVARARAGAGQLVGEQRARAWRAAAIRTAALGRRGLGEARSVRVLARAGLIRLDPLATAGELRMIASYGQLGAPLALAATRYGAATGLIDELGSLSFSELDERAGRLAAALHARGIGGSDIVGILCANHRGLIDITFAAARLGARIVLLDPEAGAGETRELVRREGLTLLVHDAEHTAAVAELALARGRLLAWRDGADPGLDSLDALIRAGAELPPAPAPAHPSAVVLMTSGTTGFPRGVLRRDARGLAPVGAVLSKLPLRIGEATYLAAPMSHGTGYAQMLLALTLGSTLIVERRFDPERVVGAVTAHAPTALVLVPAMLAGVLVVLEQSLNLYDLSSLRVVAVSGAPLEPGLVQRTQASVGRVLHNLYGTTEVAYATFASPEDLAAAPGCAGRPPFGTLVRLLDDAGRPLTGADRVGRIFVDAPFACDGYSDGSAPEVIDGLMDSGDLGRFDEAGRLWVQGRREGGDAAAVVAEIEAALAGHPGIVEAAVLSPAEAPDAGRLVACVVLARDHQVGAEQIRKFLAARLSGDARGADLDVRFLTGLPRNPSGKVQTRALAELLGELGAG